MFQYAALAESNVGLKSTLLTGNARLKNSGTISACSGSQELLASVGDTPPVPPALEVDTWAGNDAVFKRSTPPPPPPPVHSSAGNAANHWITTFISTGLLKGCCT